MRILLVDDSRTTRAIIRKTISMAHVDCDAVFEAGDGAEALEVLGSESVDIVITDINMPNVDGASMLKQMRMIDALNAVRVIVVATDASQERKEELSAYGVHAFIQKPFTPEELGEAIRRES